MNNDPIKVWIDRRDFERMTRVYVGDNHHNYALGPEGKLITYAFTPVAPTSEQVFMQGPSEFIDAIAQGFAEHIQRAGGINQEQRHAGRIEALEAEVKWLRSLIDRQIPKAP